MSEADLLTSVGLEQAELRVEMAHQAEAQASNLISEARAHTPENDQERAAYRAKAEQVQRLLEDRLQTIADACSLVPELIGRLDEVEVAERIRVLTTYLPAILEGEAATSRALGAALDTVREIEAAIERSE